MRALVMRPGQLIVENRPLPEPGQGQVLLKTLACGICGSDLHLFRHAEHYYQMGLDAAVPREILDKGVVLGHEFIGEIIQFGPNTEQKLAVGTRVCSIPFIEGDLVAVPIGSTPLIDGAYAEYFLLSEKLLITVPENLSTEAAALTEPLAIGIHAVNRANLSANPVAVVMGCGPIGLAVIAALRMKGIEHIVAGDFSRKRRELAAEMGASVVVDAAVTSPFAQLPAVKAIDPAVIFECTGVNGLIGQCVEAAPKGSEIVVAGITHGEDKLIPATAISKELSLYFVGFYTTEEFESALAALATGQINWRPWITGRVDLDGVAGAFEDLKDPEQHAKILIYPNGQ